MSDYTLMANAGSYNKFKKCYSANVCIVRNGSTECLVAASGDYRTKKEAITECKKTVDQFMVDYKEYLN